MPLCSVVICYDLLKQDHFGSETLYLGLLGLLGLGTDEPLRLPLGCNGEACDVNGSERGAPA